MKATARGNLVNIVLLNHGPGTFLAGPKCFAVIERAGKQVTPFKMGVDAAQMPVKQLAPGESIQGLIRFVTLGDVVGELLVYKAPGAGTAYVRCVIQPQSGNTRPSATNLP